MSNFPMPNNCAIREFTADHVSVGRCCHGLAEGDVCPRHGDVSDAMELYRSYGSLTSEWTEKAGWRERRGAMEVRVFTLAKPERP